MDDYKTLRKLDNLWSTIVKLFAECRIDLAKIDDIPELKLEKLSVESKRSLVKRFRYLRCLNVYKSIIETCESLGAAVTRDKHGKHTIQLRQPFSKA